MDQTVRKVVRFDRFDLDLTRGCLRLDGQEIELRPKAFQVLAYLALNAGRLLPKQELLEAVWPDVTVTDESLVQCIRELRQKLGDDRHRLIKTVPRRGYMLDVVTPPNSESPQAGWTTGLLRLRRLAAKVFSSRILLGSQAGVRHIWLATGALACVLLGAYLLLPLPGLFTKIGWSHRPPVPPAASKLFTEDDAKRVAAIAATKQLPLPAFQILEPAADVPKGLRRFVGIWVSDAGWFNSGRQFMLIVTRVDRDGMARGYVLDGPPQPKSDAQNPASYRPFKAHISGDSLSYGDASVERVAGLTNQNRIEFWVRRRDGKSAVVSLDPVWTLVEAERTADRKRDGTMTATDQR